MEQVSLAPLDVTAIINLRSVARPQLVVILEDFEAFNSRALSDLIESAAFVTFLLNPLMCFHFTYPVYSQRAAQLPLVFIFCIATSLEAVHTVLPRSVTSRLHTSHFFVEEGIETVYALLKGVSLDYVKITNNHAALTRHKQVFIDGDVALSPSVSLLHSITRTFEHVNHSVDSVVSKLQACLTCFLCP
jgi:hypothetical protein